MLALLLAPFALWIGLLIVVPHIDIFILSVSEKVAPRTYRTSLANYEVFLDEPVYWLTLARTVVMSVLATALTLLIAFPAAYFIAKLARGRAKGFLLLLCLLPFWASELVRTLGWMILLRE
ncbi:MAG: ABC transporter permease, partial [Alphaproteobacteria bacterium]|nr:ABC transporter permease [Alphaproteobacteria bacterium]